jgi:hypothetical protein
VHTIDTPPDAPAPQPIGQGDVGGDTGHSARACLPPAQEPGGALINVLPARGARGSSTRLHLLESNVGRSTARLTFLPKAFPFICHGILFQFPCRGFPHEGVRPANPAVYKRFERHLVTPLVSLILGQRARLFNFLLKKQPESANLLPSTRLAGCRGTVRLSVSRRGAGLRWSRGAVKR